MRAAANVNWTEMFESLRQVCDGLVDQTLRAIEVPSRTPPSPGDLSAVRLVVDARPLYVVVDSLVGGGIEQFELQFENSLDLTAWPGGPPIPWKEPFHLKEFVVADALMVVDRSSKVVGLEIISRSGERLQLRLGALPLTLQVDLRHS